MDFKRLIFDEQYGGFKGIAIKFVLFAGVLRNWIASYILSDIYIYIYIFILSRILFNPRNQRAQNGAGPGGCTSQGLCGAILSTLIALILNPHGDIHNFYQKR